ncbi:MAG: hypothetical protein RL268_436 [Pseudomonadota bacterium]
MVDTDANKWWQIEAKRYAVEEAKRAIDALSSTNVELDNWQKDCLAGALGSIFNGLYTLSVRCSRDALLSLEERIAGTSVVLDPYIAQLDIRRFREILQQAEHYPVVRPTFG